MFILVDRHKNTYIITAEDLKENVKINFNKVKKNKNKRELYKTIKKFIEGDDEK